MKLPPFMKSLSLILALVLPLSSLFAEPLRDSENPLNPDSGVPETEVTFLGLLANKLSPVVSRQLGLSGNLYLSVAMVSPDGPAPTMTTETVVSARGSGRMGESFWEAMGTRSGDLMRGIEESALPRGRLVTIDSEPCRRQPFRPAS